MKAREARRKRRWLRKEVEASLRAMPDDSLRNLSHELGREMGQQGIIMNELRARLDSVKREIERRKTLTSEGVHISDHAVLRYLERYKGIDTREIREEIVTMAKRAGKLGSGNQYARRTDGETGITMGINEANNSVTTVFTEDEAIILRRPPLAARLR